MSYPKLHLPLRELRSLFQQQLRVEMATTVAVESVEQARVLTEEVLRAVRSSAGSQPRGRAGAGGGGSCLCRLPRARGGRVLTRRCRADAASGCP